MSMNILFPQNSVVITLVLVENDGGGLEINMLTYRQEAQSGDVRSWT